MGLAHQAAASIGHSLENVRAGARKLASRKLGLGPPALVVTSSSILADGRLATACTVDSIHRPEPPVLRWSSIPSDTRSLVVICEDPDAPFPEPFAHWLLYDIPSVVAGTEKDPAPGVEGKNSKLGKGYAGAAPPVGHGPHRYHFQLFALDRVLGLPPNSGRSALLDAMRGRVIAWGEIVGHYERR